MARNPATWVAVAILSVLAPLLLPSGAVWPLALVAGPVAMTAAVVTAYQQAARIRAGHAADPRHPSEGS
ncbi:hypothetical protein GCM10018955_32020 [Planomonospora venezuelensis]